MKKIIAVAVSAVALSSTGCGWLTGDDGIFRDRSNDYRAASADSPLELPPGIETTSIEDAYAVPVISDRTSLDDNFTVPAPEPLDEGADSSQVRINKLGDQRWILLNGSPGQTWPRLRGFLTLNQLGVQRADAANGIIETGWLQPSGEDNLRERYQMRVDQGVQRGTSEVYILQADIRAGEDDWPASSSNPEREAQMTQALAQYLADSAAAAAVSLLAQQAFDDLGRITLEQDEQANVFIKLQLPFDRAWASVGSALPKAGYAVDDLNRDQRTYYVQYQEEAEKEAAKPGFFARLLGRSANQETDSLESNYLIKVQSQNDRTVRVFIRDENGQVIAKKDSERLLKLLKRHIS